MDERSTKARVAALTAVAERFDALAETAELMGDASGAESLREGATRRRLEAMAVLGH